MYRCAKQHSETPGEKRGVKMDELTLTPTELINSIAAAALPPRTHRHCCLCLMVSNSPVRSPKITEFFRGCRLGGTAALEAIGSVPVRMPRCPTRS